MHAEGRDQESLAVLADLVGGRVSGDPSTRLSGVAPLDTANAQQISFLANPKYRDKLAGSQAGAIIVHPSLEGASERPLLLVNNPYLAFAKILTYFKGTKHVPQGISPRAEVHAEASVAADVTISPGCVIGAGAVIGRGTCLHPNVVIYPGVVIGEDCTLHANVTIREACRIGDRVIIQPGAIIGSDGFGYAPDGEKYFKIPQVGAVILEDDVEIGSCTCIDRGTLGDTRIARGTKIDNLVQIGHNVQVGEDSILVSQVGISGSTLIGRHCTFGGQSATSGHLKVGDNVTIAARGGVSNDVDGNQVMAGLPLQPHRDWLKTTMCLPHLPEMRRELKRIQQQLAELKTQSKKGEK